MKRRAMIAAAVLSVWPSHARADCPPLPANDLFGGAGPRPRQTSLVQADPAGFAESVLNFRVLLRDEGMPAEGIPPSGPINALDQARYCAIANEWSRLTYIGSQGTHRIGRVTFYWDQEMNWQEGEDAEVRWQRWSVPADGGPGRPYAWNVTSAGSNSATIYAYDNPIGCPLLPALDDGGQLTESRPCVDWPDVAADLQCSEMNINGLSGSYCVDPIVGHPILRPPHSAGWVFAHENAHFFYGADDEYSASNGLAVCLGEYAETPYGETSIMSTHGRDAWCDGSTHLTELTLEKPGFDPVGLCNRVEGSTWSAASTNWAELQGVHDDGTYPVADTTDLPPVECVFELTPTNDYVLLLDRSFSMASFVNSGTGLDAFDNARQAAVGLYDQVPADAESAAIYTYNTNVQKPIPYAPRDAVIEALGPELGGINPGGNTDICKAIRQAADDLNTANPGAGIGNAVLLSDGLPTVASCDTDAEVLEAAEYACSRPVPVRVYTLAFGDADEELLQQVAQTCAASSFSTSAATAGFEEAPEELKFELARLGYEARGYQPVLQRRQPLAAAQEESIVVPSGTAELNVAWVGDGYDRLFTHTGQPTTCDFGPLGFQLVSPKGVVSAPAPAATPLGTAERNAQFVHVSVRNPAAGTWKMRLDATGYPCHTPAGDLGDPFTGYRPRIHWQAGIRHHTLRALAEASPAVAPRDKPIRVTASLRFPEPWRAAPLAVEGRVHHDGLVTPLLLSDDGAQGDAAAGDGVYTGLFNPEGEPRPAGFYEVTVQMRTIPRTTRGVVGETERLEAVPNGPESAAPAPGAADVTARTTFVLEGCCRPGQTAGCSPCRTGDCATPLFGTLRRGGRYPGLTLSTAGFSASSAADLGLGAGVRVSNVRVPSGDTGQTVAFDAAVDASAPLGPRVATLQDRHRRCASGPEDIRVCEADGRPVIRVQEVRYTASGSGPFRVELSAPSVGDGCGGRDVTVRAWLIRINGASLSSPIAIDAARPVVTVPVGTHLVRWVVQGPAGQAEAVQTIRVGR
jgi:von Willebrand factor type A domain-containing protein